MSMLSHGLPVPAGAHWSDPARRSSTARPATTAVGADLWAPPDPATIVRDLWAPPIGAPVARVAMSPWPAPDRTLRIMWMAPPAALAMTVAPTTASTPVSSVANMAPGPVPAAWAPPSVGEAIPAAAATVAATGAVSAALDSVATDVAEVTVSGALDRVPTDVADVTVSGELDRVPSDLADVAPPVAPIGAIDQPTPAANSGPIVSLSEPMADSIPKVGTIDPSREPATTEKKAVRWRPLVLFASAGTALAAAVILLTSLL